MINKASVENLISSVSIQNKEVRKTRSRFSTLFAISMVALAGHRKDVGITCVEDCWCWDLESEINTIAKEMEDEL